MSEANNILLLKDNEKFFWLVIDKSVSWTITHSVDFQNKPNGLENR